MTILVRMIMITRSININGQYIDDYKNDYKNNYNNKDDENFEKNNKTH